MATDPAHRAVTFQVVFPAGERGGAATILLADAVARSYDRLCTVS